MTEGRWATTELSWEAVLDLLTGSSGECSEKLRVINLREKFCRLSKSSSTSIEGREIERAGESWLVSPAGHHHPHQSSSKPVLSARDLTGAPLISLVASKTRKVRPGPPSGPRKYYERQRHNSDQATIPSSYYAGQNLYQVRYDQYQLARSERVQDRHIFQKLMVDRGYPYLQDFYQNPTFASRNLRQQQAGVESHSYQHPLVARRDKLSGSKSSENLSDTISVTSEEEDNFKPRIIRPRR